MIFLTTTAIEVDEELLNRCLVLTVDEDREQTRAIHRAAARARRRSRACSRGSTARAMLQAAPERPAPARARCWSPTPSPRQLTFLDDRTRTRRDHVKYLTLIRADRAPPPAPAAECKTVEHGGQAVAYIEVTLDDIAIANRLAARGPRPLARRAAAADAPAAAARSSELVARASASAQAIERAELRFTPPRGARARRAGATRSSRSHLARLVELEYLVVHRGAHAASSFVYELLYDGQGKDGRPFLSGLIDVATFGSTNRSAYDANRSGQNAQPVGPRSAPGRGVVGGWSEPSDRLQDQRLQLGIERLRRNTRLGQRPRNGVVVREDLASVAHAAVEPALDRRRRRRRRRSAARAGRAAPRATRAIRAASRCCCARLPRVARRAQLLGAHGRGAEAHPRLLRRLVRRARPHAAGRGHGRVLERYQRRLFHYRRKNGRPLSLRHAAASPGLRQGLLPLARARALPPARPGLRASSCPRRGRGCRVDVLHADEVEQVLASPDLDDAARAARPRASSRRSTRPAMRRSELCSARRLRPRPRARLADGAPGQGRQGPRRADRRARARLGGALPRRGAAAARARRRPRAPLPHRQGEPLRADALSRHVKRDHVRRRRRRREPGACHLFRHTWRR